MIVYIDETTKLRAQALLHGFRERNARADLPFTLRQCVREGLHAIDAAPISQKAPSGEAHEVEIDPFLERLLCAAAERLNASIGAVASVAAGLGAASFCGVQTPGEKPRFRLGATPLGAA